MSNVKVSQHEKGNAFQPQKKCAGALGRGKNVDYNLDIKKLLHA